MDHPVLFLKKREDRRLRSGHPWVYSNEVDVDRSPLAALEPGQQVEVRAQDGRPLGMAYVNPRTLISARLYSRHAGESLDRALLARRVARALALRARIFESPQYRLVHGEGDGLPGLVVDRYGDLLVVQLATAGMERLREAVLEVLRDLTGAKVVVLRNDLPGRALEGLAQAVEVPIGEAPEWHPLEENGCRFRFSPRHGQKTGWFWDQRLNRARLPAYVRGARVLDVFSYDGAWGVQAARAGAARVTCVDASADALERLAANAALNGVGGRVEALQGDAFDRLKDLREAGERFDVVVVDPPAFIKRVKDREAGLEAYQRLNRLAMRVLAPDGVLVSCSCSFHLDRAELLDLLYRGARHADRGLQVLEHGHQGPDHPVHPAIPETAYLKCATVRVYRD
ncbi:MAG: class I SAM-dependent rRNA methyltransferase [Gammaproteobacteria bacterium]|nr:class I SAM-dependent rRNA methyltransferase [Gammaproteobacteria bacterium]